jgi:hypothetical protein
VSSAWREDMLTRAGELEGLKSWIVANGNGKPPGDMLKAIEEHLKAVGARLPTRARAIS